MDGALAVRTSPHEHAWWAYLTDQLDRLLSTDDSLVCDLDALSGLVCEVAAAVLEAGLSLHDCADRAGKLQLGGVCLFPAPCRERSSFPGRSTTE
jgi:hypothetical protein